MMASALMGGLVNGAKDAHEELEQQGADALGVAARMERELDAAKQRLRSAAEHKVGLEKQLEKAKADADEKNASEWAALLTRFQEKERRVEILEGNLSLLRELTPGDLIDVQRTIDETAWKVNQLTREAAGSTVCQICLHRAADWSLMCGHRGCKVCFTQMKDNAVRSEEIMAHMDGRAPAPSMRCHACRQPHPISRSVRDNGEPGEWELCGHTSY